MSDTLPELIFLSDNDRGRVVMVVGASTAAAASELVAAAPSLAEPACLARYCEAVNYLARGEEYHVILDPDAYRTKYHKRLASEDPNEPWQEGRIRLSDFGVARTEEIKPPHRDGASVVFYAEDDFLGIPYRVTAPAPDHPEGTLEYDPVPMKPLPASPQVAPNSPQPVEESASVVAPGIEQKPAPVTPSQAPPAVPKAVETKAAPAAPTPATPAPAAPQASDKKPSVPATAPPVAPATPPPPPPKPPSPLELLADAVTRLDQAGVQKHLLTLGVDQKIVDRIISAWKGLAASDTLKPQRMPLMLGLISTIKELKNAGKVQDELWRLQKALTKYNS